MTESRQQFIASIRMQYRSPTACSIIFVTKIAAEVLQGISWHKREIYIYVDDKDLE